MPSVARAQELGRSLPRGIPSAATLAGWERADGRADDGNWSVVYSLYVNPDRPGLYEVTRFRVGRVTARPGQPARRVDETEKLLWNARPGSRDPLVCYERAGRRRWWTFGIRRWSWRTLTPGTDAYRAAMFTAIRVYDLYRARLGLPPPGQ